MVAQQLYELCETVGKDLARTELLQSYEQLLMDNEAEVRIASTGSVSAFCQLVGAEAATSKIVPRVKDLRRGSVAAPCAPRWRPCIMGLAPTLGQGPSPSISSFRVPHPAQG